MLWLDYRRHLRPFFLEAGLVTPTKYKIYYDIICWLVIQTSYNYVAPPFLILTIWDSLRLWARLKVPSYTPEISHALVLRPHWNLRVTFVFP